MSLKAFLPFVLLMQVAPILSVSQEPQAGTQDEVKQHALLAQEYLREKRPDLAIPELQKVVELDPANIDARGNLGVLYFFHKDYKEAIPQLRAALQAKPDLWRIQGLLGLAEARTGEGESSTQDLQASLPHLTDEKFQAEVGEALINEYAALKNYEKAAQTASDLLATRPTNVALLYTTYSLYSDLVGRSMLTLALTAPGSAEMHQVMARELARHGDNTAAIANYREAIKINPDLPGLHSELGDLLYHSDDQKLQAEAKTEFQAALALNPRDERAEMTLGEIAEKQGDQKAAYAHFSRALEIDPSNSDACASVAKILVYMNEKEKARQLFEHAVELDPTNEVAHYRLSTLYREAGRTEESKQQAAEYVKYKKMKEKLEKIFHDMRVLSNQHPTDDQDEK